MPDPPESSSYPPTVMPSSALIIGVAELGRCCAVGGWQPSLQRHCEVRVVSSRPHELFSRLCQSCLHGLLLVVAGEPSGSSWFINWCLLPHKIALVDRHAPRLLFSAAVSSTVAQAEVGDVLSAIVKKPSASHTLKYANMTQKKNMTLFKGVRCWCF